MNIMRMNRKEIGAVNEEENLTIRHLFERLNGLNELAKIVTADNNDLYEKLVGDLGETSIKFQNWWNSMAQKYKWESSTNGHWEIDFDTNKVYICTEE